MRWIESSVVVALGSCLPLVSVGCGGEAGGGTAGEASASEASSSGAAEPTGTGEASATAPTDGTTGASASDGSGGGSDSMSSSGTTEETTDPGTSATTDPSTSSGASPAGCGDGVLDPGEACDDGNDNPFDGCLPDCTAVEKIDAPALQWKYFEVPGTLCMNGNTAGFGISINPDSTNLMIYLEGGGACFNDACDFSAFNIPFIPPPDGIFNRNNPQNPVKDWSMIYVPYCSGDIHGGDRDTMLGGQVRHFRGYRNVTKYLEQWVPTFAGVDKVLLTGISAGGFGAGLNAVQVAKAFGPGPQLIVLDDSGPPLDNSVIPPCLQQTFREVWGLDDTILAECGVDCSDPDDFASGVLRHTLENYPEVRFGLFSHTADLVIRTFMSFGWGNGMHDNCGGVPLIAPANVYEGGLLGLRDQYKGRAATYYIGQTQVLYNFGQGHTVLRSPTFWTTVIDGVPLPQWLAGVIDGEVEHVGP